MESKPKIVFADSGTGKSFFIRNIDSSYYELPWNDNDETDNLSNEEYTKLKFNKIKECIEKGINVVSIIPTCSIEYFMKNIDYDCVIYYPAATLKMKKSYLDRFQKRRDVKGYEIRQKWFIIEQLKRDTLFRRFRNEKVKLVKIYNPDLYLSDFYDKENEQWSDDQSGRVINNI